MIDIIIVNWNAGSQLVDVLSSLVSFHHDLVGSVIVVDNGSTDDSLTLVERSIKEPPFNLKFIHNVDNRGFGAACNQGVELVDSEYLLFLNPDARVYEDTLAKAFNYMQSPENSSVGICGVQLIDEEGHISRSCTRFPSAIGLVAHAVGLDRFFPRTGHFMGEWDHAQTRIVDHLIGAFFLVRRELFVSLNGFDERFFVYLEDLDFSYRAKQAGWSSVYLASAQAFHAGGGTSNQVKAKRLFYSLRSRILYAFKHFSWLGACIALLATILLEPFARSLLTLFRLSWSGFIETMIAYRMLFVWLIQWIWSSKFR
jgi:GT2 family glycosyltransferase